MADFPSYTKPDNIQPAQKPSPANYQPTLPQYPNAVPFQPVYGRYDLTTYIQGMSDYEIMCYLVAQYNIVAGGFDQAKGWSKQLNAAYGQLQEWCNQFGENVTDDINDERTWLNDFSDNISANYNQLIQWVNDWFDNVDIANELIPAVDSVLSSHPEWVTTVMDGSLTVDKFTSDLKLATVKDYVTPQMYGATGDGTTDDTQAFTDMFASDNVNFYIPAGTYKITTVNIAKQISLIRGCGKSSVIKGSFNFTVKNENLAIENVCFSGSTSYALQGSFAFTNFNNVRISNCPTGIICNSGTWIVNFFGCSFMYCSTSCVSHNTDFNNITFTGCQFQYSGAGIVGTSCTSVTLEGCSIELNTGEFFQIEIPRGVNLISCYIEKNPTLIVANNQFQVRYDITNCFIYNPEPVEGIPMIATQPTYTNPQSGGGFLIVMKGNKIRCDGTYNKLFNFTGTNAYSNMCVCLEGNTFQQSTNIQKPLYFDLFDIPGTANYQVLNNRFSFYSDIPLLYSVNDSSIMEYCIKTVDCGNWGCYRGRCVFNIFGTISSTRLTLSGQNLVLALPATCAPSYSTRTTLAFYRNQDNSGAVCYTEIGSSGVSFRVGAETNPISVSINSNYEVS